MGSAPCLSTPSTSSVVVAHRARFARRPLTAHPSHRLSLLPQNGTKWRASQWLENSAAVDVEVPLEEAWTLWEDRTRIPQWMDWITSVTVLEDDPRMSKWMLSTYQFNRQQNSHKKQLIPPLKTFTMLQWQFSWLALNLTPLKNQKIHWRSVPGSTGGSLGALEIQNRGQIRFMRKGPSKCSVKLTISYEVPNVLAPFANLLTPLVESILQNDMKKFTAYALKHRPLQEPAQ